MAVLAFNQAVRAVVAIAAGAAGAAAAAAVVGYMWKRGTKLNHLVRRWYVLTPAGLCYYPSAQESVRAK